MIQIHNCHTHIFTIEHVPKQFLPFQLVRFLAKRKHSEWFARILNAANPRSNSDIFSRYASFIRQGSRKSQEDILTSLMEFYPENTRFVILTMDMEYMNAGILEKSYTQQLDEIVKLIPSYRDRIYPFVFAHPQRNDLLAFIIKYIEQGFKGIKIYPPLGYFPFDQRLYPVYEYAEKHNIPIMTHCSRGGVYTREKRSSLPGIHPITGEKLTERNRKKLTDNFTNPENFEYLLKDFKDLKICFGHFGGKDELETFQDSTDREKWEQSWFTKIKKLLKTYHNTYADLSYTLSDLSLVPLVNITLLSEDYRDKILFGSDFYMANIEGNEYKFSIYLRNALGEENFKRIAETNPMRYLGTNTH